MRGAMLACIGIGRIAYLDAIGGRRLAVVHIGSRKGGAEGIYLQTRTGIMINAHGTRHIPTVILSKFTTGAFTRYVY